MRISSLATFGMVVSAGLVLSGCAGWPHQDRDPIVDIFAQSCKGIPKPTAGVTLNIRGLDIPFKPTTPIKLGALDFEVEDARRVSDAIYALSESRQNQCSYLAAALLGNPRPPGVWFIAALDGVNNSSRQTDAILAILQTRGENPKQAVAVAEKASEVARAAEEKAKATLSQPIPPNPPVAPLPKVGFGDLTEDVAADIAQSRDIVAVKGELKSIRAQIEDMKKAAPFQQFSLSGFDVGGATLTLGMKDDLAAQFKSALVGVPSPQVARVAIVGYADESGIYLNNVSLGLKRAKTVAAFLERNFPKQAEIKIVSSGGILSNVPNGRRVDLIIS